MGVQGFAPARQPDQWVPACGGAEEPFTYNGKRYLYMWNITTGQHAYYCANDDRFYVDYREGV